VVERGKAFLGGNWNLDLIEVTDSSRGHTWKWKCGKWFNDKVRTTPTPLPWVLSWSQLRRAGGSGCAVECNTHRHTKCLSLHPRNTF